MAIKAKFILKIQKNSLSLGLSLLFLVSSPLSAESDLLGLLAGNTKGQNAFKAPADFWAGGSSFRQLEIAAHESSPQSLSGPNTYSSFVMDSVRLAFVKEGDYLGKALNLPSEDLAALRSMNDFDMRLWGSPYRVVAERLLKNKPALLQRLKQMDNETFSREMEKYIQDFYGNKGPLFEAFSPTARRTLEVMDGPEAATELKKLFAANILSAYSDLIGPNVLKDRFEPHDDGMLNRRLPQMRNCASHSRKDNNVDCENFTFPVSNPERYKALAGLIADHDRIVIAEQGGFSLTDYVNPQIDPEQKKAYLEYTVYQGCVHTELSVGLLGQDKTKLLSTPKAAIDKNIQKIEESCGAYAWGEAWDKLPGESKTSLKENVLKAFFNGHVQSDFLLGNLGHGFEAKNGNKDTLDKYEHLLKTYFPQQAGLLDSMKSENLNLKEYVDNKYGIKLVFNCNEIAEVNSGLYKKHFTQNADPKKPEEDLSNKVIVGKCPRLNFSEALKNKSEAEIGKMLSDTQFWQYIEVLRSNNPTFGGVVGQDGKFDESNDQYFQLLKFTTFFQTYVDPNHSPKLSDEKHPAYENIYTDDFLKKSLIARFQKMSTEIAPEEVVRNGKKAKIGSGEFHRERLPMFIGDSVIVPHPSGQLEFMTAVEYHNAVRDSLGAVAQINEDLLKKGENVAGFWNAAANGSVNYLNTGLRYLNPITGVKNIIGDSLGYSQMEIVEVGKGGLTELYNVNANAANSANPLLQRLSLLGIYKVAEDNKDPSSEAELFSLGAKKTAAPKPASFRETFMADAMMGPYRQMLDHIVNPGEITEGLKDQFLEGYKAGAEMTRDLAMLVVPSPIKGQSLFRVISGTGVMAGRAAWMGTGALVAGTVRTVRTGRTLGTLHSAAGGTMAAVRSARAMSWGQRGKTFAAGVKNLTEGGGKLAEAYRFGSSHAYMNLAFMKGIGGGFGMGIPAFQGAYAGKGFLDKGGVGDSAARTLLMGNDLQSQLIMSANLGFAYFGGGQIKEAIMASRMKHVPQGLKAQYQDMYKKSVDQVLELKKVAASEPVQVSKGWAELQKRLATPNYSPSPAQIAADLRIMQRSGDYAGNILPGMASSATMHYFEDKQIDQQRAQINQELVRVNGEIDRKIKLKVSTAAEDEQKKELDKALANLDSQKKWSYGMDVVLTAATMRFNASLNNLHLNMETPKRAQIMEAELGSFEARFKPVQTSANGTRVYSLKAVPKSFMEKLKRAEEVVSSGVKSVAQKEVQSTNFDGVQNTGNPISYVELPVPYEIVKNSKGEEFVIVHPKGTVAQMVYDDRTQKLTPAWQGLAP